MKIISDLPDYLVNSIRKLISKGRYSTISEFLLTAAENQLALESGEAYDVLDLTQKKSIDTNQTINSDFHIPESEIPILELTTIKEAVNIWDMWIWGQINRILPMKFASRFLAIEAVKQGGFPEKKAFNTNASEEARRFGFFLGDQDDKLKKPRDEMLSTGFPVGKKIERSLDRYWKQFIGYQRNDETLTGGLFDLALANVCNDENGKLRIGLNSEGRKFALMQNPVLDNHNFDQSLSKNEKEFYLNHIQAHVPGEVSLFKVLLNLLDNGIVRREELNVKLSKYVESAGWSDGLISTQRSGAFSRMYELGLISKDRDGLKVRYGLTNSGGVFLKRVS